MQEGLFSLVKQTWNCKKKLIIKPNLEIVKKKSNQKQIVYDRSFSLKPIKPNSLFCSNLLFYSRPNLFFIYILLNSINLNFCSLQKYKDGSLYSERKYDIELENANSEKN